MLGTTTFLSFLPIQKAFGLSDYDISVIINNLDFSTAATIVLTAFLADWTTKDQILLWTTTVYVFGLLQGVQKNFHEFG